MRCAGRADGNFADRHQIGCENVKLPVPWYGEYCTVPEYALLFGPGGIAAARDYAEEHALEVSEPRLEPEAIARRDTELRRAPCSTRGPS